MIMETKRKISSVEKKIDPSNRKKLARKRVNQIGTFNRGANKPKDVFGIVLLGVSVIVLIGIAIVIAVVVVNKMHNKNRVTLSTVSNQTTGTTFSIPKKAYQAVTTAISSKDTSILSGTYAKNVHLIIKQNDVNAIVAGSDVNALISGIINGITGSCNWQISTSLLSQWQNGPYGQYFSGNDLVGLCNDGTVISIVFDSGGQIVTVFIAPETSLVTPSSGSTTDSSGSSTTTDNNAPPSSDGGTGTQTPLPVASNGSD
jgi:hypothetical protein